MACCGRRSERSPVASGLPSFGPSAPAAATRHEAPPATPVQFEYVGATAMTVLGAASRRRYRFAATGARLQVDARDAPSLAAVPHLRRVRPA